MINLKTEIIYFKCNNDFEFEFNLNTALQIRLFTECPTNGKALLGALSLAVSRSRAIIITSKFDEELITKLAGAIGFNTETINPAEYGITKMSTDKLITCGVPLVTNDGIYAGIILESGPQSLIIITDERTTRKKLMSELVHGYLNDIAITTANTTPTVAKKVQNAAVEDTTAPKVVEDIPADVDIDATKVTEKDMGESEDKVIEEIAIEAEDDVIDDTIIENDNIIDEPVIFEQIDDIDTDDERPVPNRKRATDIFTAILAVILFLLVAFIVYSLIIDPFLNNISIEENFKHIWGFLFE